MLEALGNAAISRNISAVDDAFVQDTLAQNLRRFDKGGDAFYDQISALHKSVRGSSPDASLYWLVRMLDGGAHPLYVGRRLVKMGGEGGGPSHPPPLRVRVDARETDGSLDTPGSARAL